MTVRGDGDHGAPLGELVDHRSQSTDAVGGIDHEVGLASSNMPDVRLEHRGDVALDEERDALARVARPRHQRSATGSWEVTFAPR